MIDTVYMTTEDDLRSRLLVAASDLLARDGIEAVTIRAVARRCGVSHGAPRRWFPTRANLLATLAAAGFTTLGDELAQALTEGGRAGIESAGRSYVTYALEHPALFELMFRHDLLEGSGENLRQVSLPVFQEFAAAVQLARRPKSASAEAIATGLWAQLHGIATLESRRSLDVLGPQEPAELVAAAIRTHLGR